MKQEDKLSIIDTMEKDINEHKKGGPWLINHRDTLPNKAWTIETTLSLKRKQKQDGMLLKYKY